MHQQSARFAPPAPTRASRRDREQARQSGCPPISHPLASSIAASMPVRDFQLLDTPLTSSPSISPAASPPPAFPDAARASTTTSTPFGWHHPVHALSALLAPHCGPGRAAQYSAAALLPVLSHSAAYRAFNHLVATGLEHAHAERLIRDFLGWQVALRESGAAAMAVTVASATAAAAVAPVDRLKPTAISGSDRTTTVAAPAGPSTTVGTPPTPPPEWMSAMIAHAAAAEFGPPNGAPPSAAGMPLHADVVSARHYRAGGEPPCGAPAVSPSSHPSPSAIPPPTPATFDPLVDAIMPAVLAVTMAWAPDTLRAPRDLTAWRLWTARHFAPSAVIRHAAHHLPRTTTIPSPLIARYLDAHFRTAKLVEAHWAIPWARASVVATGPTALRAEIPDVLVTQRYLASTVLMTSDLVVKVVDGLVTEWAVVVHQIDELVRAPVVGMRAFQSSPLVSPTGLPRAVEQIVQMAHVVEAMMPVVELAIHQSSGRPLWDIVPLSDPKPVPRNVFVAAPPPPTFGLGLTDSLYGSGLVDDEAGPASFDHFHDCVSAVCTTDVLIFRTGLGDSTLSGPCPMIAMQ
ncbi:hypothetical protein AMAG_08801 [Allomyces macrogynus ATCC 38327]|uniref:Uncharacterized protein n=1 Tax=Allomyces macrogynus (strain ATCC 38327) TaxID=578462 RepID=A0A0L0SMB1_ALLM3|nr:hypothetical protein AMAG_08801 [Allomyces macrogynus ATCC 38327]|eukprot:KNE63706.1 hypothetical protein AMAG_08801 [Allomyces macrogynus ATCC 38327]